LDDALGFVFVDDESCYSSDGYRISNVGFEKTKGKFGILLPSKYMVSISKHAPVEYCIADSWFYLKLGDVIFGVRCGSFDFPIAPIKDVLSKYSKAKGIPLPKGLQEILGMSLLVLTDYDDMSKHTKVSFDKSNMITVHSESAYNAVYDGQVASEKPFPKVYSGISFIVNPLFLIKSLKNYSADFFFDKSTNKIGFTADGFLSITAIFNKEKEDKDE